MTPNQPVITLLKIKKCLYNHDFFLFNYYIVKVNRPKNIMLFCKYKNSLGVPGEGVHKYRFGGIAIVDYIMTLVVAAFTSYMTGIPLILTTILWLVLAIVLHIMFCVPTSTTKYLGIH